MFGVQPPVLLCVSAIRDGMVRIVSLKKPNSPNLTLIELRIHCSKIILTTTIALIYNVVAINSLEWCPK